MVSYNKKLAELWNALTKTVSRREEINLMSILDIAAELYDIDRYDTYVCSPYKMDEKCFILIGIIIEPLFPKIDIRVLFSFSQGTQVIIRYLYAIRYHCKF